MRLEGEAEVVPLVADVRDTAAVRGVLAGVELDVLVGKPVWRR